MFALYIFFIALVGFLFGLHLHDTAGKKGVIAITIITISLIGLVTLGYCAQGDRMFHDEKRCRCEECREYRGEYTCEDCESDKVHKTRN